MRGLVLYRRRGLTTTPDISITSVPHFCQKYSVRLVVLRPVFYLVRFLLRPWPYRVAPAYGESCGAHIYPIPCRLCRLMYTHTLMVLQQMSQYFKQQSTAPILVSSGPFSLGFCLFLHRSQKTINFQHPKTQTRTKSPILGVIGLVFLGLETNNNFVGEDNPQLPRANEHIA